ncbi:putative xylitol oxidase [Lentzea sp. NBRC 105346]|uniref:D-arabinono-1,4-lactone oxidase n=1 Tax=Lentzea sp. NBRC 105346 TaxID=3032205 RepID=UPI0024A17C9B|nr:D-arabinono-1,4-lactone oxidase [Lentzea sp. NBRC 105346]GLZ28487.1 putative xylitol oxidase [Lentzea sp. NBRC 105346]
MKTNWAGNVAYSATRFASPTSLSELHAVVNESAQVHVVGAGHSFSRVADTPGTLASLEAMPREFRVGDTVHVSAGMRLAELATRLHAAGLALPTMPSLPHITVAGAVATATHGSGDAHGSLASSVRSFTLLSGRIAEPGAVVSLGALGVVTSVELEAVPAFEVEQHVWETVPWEVLLGHLDEIFASAYSVSAFVSWPAGARLWVKRRVSDPPAELGWTGAVRATSPRHPVPGQPADSCTQQLGVPGPWHERLPHFRADFTPSVGDELQSEYFVPRTRAVAALRALSALGEEIMPLLLACELRTVAADEAWLSPAHATPSLAVHFTWRPDEPAVRALLPRVEEALDPRPHWGKLFTLNDLATRYDRWADFTALLREHDPDGKFRNAFIDHHFPR